MGTKLTRGYSFATNEQLTAAKLHQLVDDAIIQAGAVGTTELAASAVSTAKLANDAVDGTKIADDAVDSEHIAAGAIDFEHFSAGARPINTPFEPASSTLAGRQGLVPTPSAGEQERFLRADGEWANIQSLIDAAATTAVAAEASIAYYKHQNFT